MLYYEKFIRSTTEDADQKAKGKVMVECKVSEKWHKLENVGH